MVSLHGRDFVTLTLHDPAGTMGFPGALDVTCTYRLKIPGTLSIELTATCEEPTVCNLTQHSYFNLDGADTALGHEISIAADFYLPTNDKQIPTGEIRSVEGTVFDLRHPTPMRRTEDGEQVLYDHNFCLSPERRAKRKVALAYSPASDITLEVHTTEPGVQFYSAFKLNVPVPGLDGRHYGPFAGFCLETQIWPDAVNHPDFPYAILRPGETLRQETDYIFKKG